MPGYYATAPDEEVREAFAAMGIHYDVNRIRSTPNGYSSTQRRDYGLAVGEEQKPTAEVTSSHQEELARLAELHPAPAEPEPFDLRTATNAECVEYFRANGLPVPESIARAAIAHPDERPRFAPRTQKEAPRDTVRRLVDQIETNPKLASELTSRQRHGLRMLRSYGEQRADL